MKIDFIDLKRQYKTIKKDIDKAIKNVINMSNFILGKEVTLFEKEFARYCGVKFALGVDSGTSALELSLRALNIKPQDKVIVPVFTFYATSASVCYVGAQPVFIDVEEETANIDVNKIEEYIETVNENERKKIKAIIPVHLFGQSCDMTEILKIAKKYNLKIIEDAAQAHGGCCRLEITNYNFHIKKLGSIGDAGAFSFYPSKNLGCYGDGGMIITNNSILANRIKLLRDSGRTERYFHKIIGYNKRLDTIQSAVLRVKLKKLDFWNSKRRKIAQLYNELLEDITEVKPLKIKDFAEPIYHAYVIRVQDRDNLVNFLKKHKISTAIYYSLPLHLQPAFKFLGYKKGDFPVAEKLSKEVLALPIFPELKYSEIEFIVKKIKKFYGK